MSYKIINPIELYSFYLNITPTGAHMEKTDFLSKICFIEKINLDDSNGVKGNSRVLNGKN